MMQLNPPDSPDILKRLVLAVMLCAAGAAVSLGARNFEFVAFADYYGGMEPSIGYENLRSRIFMRPSFFGTEERSGLEWKISANLWAQPLGEPPNIDPWDILEEAYLLLPFNIFDITVGQKIVTYGFADVFGPLNVLHSANRAAYSLAGGFEGRRPDPLVQLRFYPSFEDSIEFTYVPINRPDRERPGPVPLPGSSDRIEWSGRPYIIDNPHSLFLNYSRYGEKLDLQFLYGYYTDQTPDFRVSETEKGRTSIVKPVYRKKHTFGFAYSTRIWNMTLSQDFAFDLTSDLDGSDIGAQNSSITVNTQLLASLPWNILSQYTLVYAFHINHDGHEAGGDPEAAAYLAREIQGFHTQPRRHIAFIAAHFERSFLRDKLKAEVNLGFFFSPNIFIGPSIAFALSDYWQLAAGADIRLGDPPSDDLRRNPSNDNFYVRLLFRY